MNEQINNVYHSQETVKGVTQNIIYVEKYLIDSNFN